MVWSWGCDAPLGGAFSPRADGCTMAVSTMSARRADACLHTKVEEEVPVHESVVNREEVRMRRLSRALPQSNVVKAIRYYLRGLRDLAGTHYSRP